MFVRLSALVCVWVWVSQCLSKSLCVFPLCPSPIMFVYLSLATFHCDFSLFVYLPMCPYLDVCRSLFVASVSLSASLSLFQFATSLPRSTLFPLYIGHLLSLHPFKLVCTYLVSWKPSIVFSLPWLDCSHLCSFYSHPHLSSVSTFCFITYPWSHALSILAQFYHVLTYIFSPSFYYVSIQRIVTGNFFYSFLFFFLSFFLSLVPIFSPEPRKCQVIKDKSTKCEISFWGSALSSSVNGKNLAYHYTR